jgi:hypothetical protein
MPQVRPDWSEDCLWARIVLPAAEVGSYGLQILKEPYVNVPRVEQALHIYVQEQRGANREYGLVELCSPHLLIPRTIVCSAISIGAARWEQCEQGSLESKTDADLRCRVTRYAGRLAKFDEVEVRSRDPDRGGDPYVNGYVNPYGIPYATDGVPRPCPLAYICPAQMP